MSLSKPDLDLRRPSSIPMTELEPSPVDEDPPNDDPSNPFTSTSPQSKSSSYFPSGGSSSSSTSFTLGLTPTAHHRITTTLLALQKYSTLPLATYLILHYTNTSLIPLVTLSLPKSDSLLLLTRPYYQSPYLEPTLIFLPLATHILSGISLRLHRRFVSAKRHGAETHAQRKGLPWPKLSLTSLTGYVLYPLAAAHVFVNRILPLKVDGDSSGVGLRYFSHGFQRHPWVLGAGYVGLLGIASFHVVSGAGKFLRLGPEYVVRGGEDGRREKVWRGYVINGVAGVMWAVWVAGGLGVVGRGVGVVGASAWEVKGWDRLLEKVPLIGQWL